MNAQLMQFAMPNAHVAFMRVHFSISAMATNRQFGFVNARPLHAIDPDWGRTIANE